MTRLSIFLSVCLTAAAAEGQSSVTPPVLSRQWQRAANLLPGSHILVREAGQRLPQACTLVWIDRNALACDAYTDTGTHRVVYPAASVASVTEAPSPGEEREGSHLALPLVLAGAGALVGGLGAMDAGTRAGFAGAMLGAALGGGLGAAAVGGFGSPPERAWALRLPRRGYAGRRHGF